MSCGFPEQVVAGHAPSPVRFTVGQLRGMVEDGIVEDGEPIELIEGFLVPKHRCSAGGTGFTGSATRPPSTCCWTSQLASKTWGAT